MKSLKILLPVLVLLFFSCNSEKKKERPARIDSVISGMSPKPDTSAAAKAEIKKDSAANPPKQEQKTQVVTGTVYCLIPYCGGMRPSPEIVENTKKPHRFISSTFKLKNKSGSYTITTDKNGNFSAAIPDGEYEFWLTEKVDVSLYNVSAENCNECLTKPVTKTTIAKGKPNTITFAFHCGPDDRRRP